VFRHADIIGTFAAFPMSEKNGRLPCCEIRRKLSEKFAQAARLYAESASLLATAGISENEYTSLTRLTMEAQNRSERAFVSYEEHVDSHRCGWAVQPQAVPGCGRRGGDPRLFRP
jgi:hypothetical protein